ncbi:GyrI-like domain-containing protein [Ornithinibacillus sp. 179-J 7C1 HS]|uniref:GyrI-like domain-containing protein n=1 Tax=Ornithinibacillus sp. 179-J 7C1 HS TaxID=3142384 RepID=UPI0039A242E0
MSDKAALNLFPLENYQPQKTPHSLQVLLGQQEEYQRNRKLEVKTVTIDRFTMLAVKVSGSMENFEVGQEVRKGWNRLQDVLSSEKELSMEENKGIVFYNQGIMVQPDGRIELWVGIKVKDNTPIPGEYKCLTMTIPKRKYAKIDCRCFSRTEMDRRYRYLKEWIIQEGYQIDNGTNAFSLEPNRLDTFNPFSVPANEIQAFDFDILYPIK